MATLGNATDAARRFARRHFFHLSRELSEALPRRTAGGRSVERSEVHVKDGFTAFCSLEGETRFADEVAAKEFGELSKLTVTKGLFGA